MQAHVLLLAAEVDAEPFLVAIDAGNVQVKWKGSGQANVSR